jgi:hypothetical protein
MILLSELSRRRIRSVQKIIRVGRNEVVVVMRVDPEKGAWEVETETGGLLGLLRLLLSRMVTRDKGQIASTALASLCSLVWSRAHALTHYRLH